MYTVSIWHSLAYYKNIIYIWTRTETYVWNETAPKQIRGQIFQSIWSFVFVACFRCCCYKNLHFSIFVNLKANRNQFRSILKYIWFLKMIVQNGHSLQSKCEVQRWKHVIQDFSIPLLGYQFFMGHVTSTDQGFSSTRGMRLEPFVSMETLRISNIRKCQRVVCTLQNTYRTLRHQWDCSH